MTPDMLDPRGQLSLGQDSARFRSRLENPPVARTYGNASVADLDVSPDTRQAPPAYPGHGGLSFRRGGQRGDGGASSFAGLRFPVQQQPGAWYSPGGPGGAYGGGWADGVLTVRDRHVLTRFGHVRNPGGGGSSMPTREGPGLAPVPPRYQMVDTSESWQIGTDLTTNEDNPGPHNWVPVAGTGKRFPLGQQDGSLTLVMGPPLSTWREYGARGPVGMHGPDPDQIDPNWVPRTGAGGAGGRGRLVAAGAPGMQPADRRTIYGGVPHGLHSPTVDSRVLTGARFASTPQQQPPRMDRPASSRVAGQSLSQTYPPEGALSSRAVPRGGTGDRRPGLDQRFRGRS